MEGATIIAMALVLVICVIQVIASAFGAVNPGAAF